MNYFDNELNILEWFQDISLQYVWFPYQSNDSMSLFSSVNNYKNFKEWINSSGKSDPPPDFYNPKLKIMMDVMRIDDHGHMNKKGKFTNPVNQKESEIQKQIRNSGILDVFPNVQHIVVNAISDLPTYEDHNHNFYFENFSRTIKKHITNIPLYKQNHPGFSTAFFVFDESTPYIIAKDENQVKKGIQRGEKIHYYSYLHFADKKFVNVFLNSDIDFLIWYSPFKHFDTNLKDVPIACVYDIKSLNISDFTEYPENLIMSVEE